MSNTRNVFESLEKQSKQWYRLLLSKERYSEYIESTLSSHFNDLMNEVKEVWESLEKWELDMKEVGDMVYMVLMFLNKLEQQWYNSELSKLWQNQKEKIFERSPNLWKHQKVSREIENRIWREFKIKQKQKWVE